MKYKAGDRVKVKSLQWFNENLNDDYNVVFADGWHFSKPMSIFCGKELIIERISHAVNPPHYMMRDNMFAWTDEMIECKIEEEAKPKKNISLTQEQINTMVHDSCVLFCKHCGCGIPRDTCTSLGTCKEHDEYRNAIRIHLMEKKKKEYPKTYEECAKVLLDRASVRNDFGYKGELLVALQKLLVCRDAYWKIAGEEMGLGKDLSWVPDWMCLDPLYVILYQYHAICRAEVNGGTSCILAFPTEEMRDAFKENFDPDIEICKELL